MENSTLFGRSATRREILGLFFSRPGVARHPRDLARQLHRSPEIVSREMRGLEAAGILVSESIGRVKRYQVDEASPIARDVGRLVRRTIGVETQLRSALADVPGIEEAFLFGSYAKGKERVTSDLDVLVVGRVDRQRLSERMVEIERTLDRDVNVVAYSRPHYDKLRGDRDPFLRDVLSGPRVVLLEKKRRNRAGAAAR